MPDRDWQRALNLYGKATKVAGEAGLGPRGAHVSGAYRLVQLERIADALERIADHLEAKRDQPPTNDDWWSAMRRGDDPSPWDTGDLAPIDQAGIDDNIYNAAEPPEVGGSAGKDPAGPDNPIPSLTPNTVSPRKDNSP